MATLKGGAELRGRLIALKGVPLKSGRLWTKEVVAYAKPKVPVRTGRLRKSFRRDTNRKHSKVYAHYTAFFIDAGPKPHDIRPKKASGSRRGGAGTTNYLKFAAGGRTIFSKRVHHPGYRARPFREAAANEGARKMDLAGTAVALWNEAG